MQIVDYGIFVYSRLMTVIHTLTCTHMQTRSHVHKPLHAHIIYFVLVYKI